MFEHRSEYFMDLSCGRDVCLRYLFALGTAFVLYDNRDTLWPSMYEAQPVRTVSAREGGCKERFFIGVLFEFHERGMVGGCRNLDRHDPPGRFNPVLADGNWNTFCHRTHETAIIQPDALWEGDEET